MAKKADGFMLYQINDDGGSSQLSGFSGISPYSGPSQDSSNTRLHGGRAPPPHSGTLRTNFKTGNDVRRSIHSSNAAHFQTLNTPPGADPVGQAPGSAPRELQAAQLAQLTSKLSMWAIIACIIIGCGLGALIHNFDVDPAVTKWIKLPGDLYVRAVQCVVIPLVFVNMVVTVSDIVHIGQGQRIGVRVALLFALTTLICVGEGIGMGYLARTIFRLTNTAPATVTSAIFGIQCSNGKYLEELSNGRVTCTASGANGTSLFIVDDVNEVVQRNDDVLASGASLTENLLTVLHMVVPANIMAAFVNNTLLSIVAFAIPCGLMLAKSFHGPIQLNPLLEFLRELNESLVMMINYVIRFTPLAVLSLLAGSFGAHLDDLMNKSPIMLTLNVTGMFAMAIAIHMLVILPLLFMAMARTNPFRYMSHLLPAYVYSLGCSSSVATLPVSMRCIEMTRAASNSTMVFVMSIGAAINMHGTAIYLPMMVMFLVDISGYNSELDAMKLLVLALGSFLCSFAAAPVPSGSLLMLTTVWGMTFPDIPLPAYYAFLVAADVVLDRLITMCNVNGDAMICRVVEEQVEGTRANPTVLRM